MKKFLNLMVGSLLVRCSTYIVGNNSFIAFETYFERDGDTLPNIDLDSV